MTVQLSAEQPVVLSERVPLQQCRDTALNKNIVKYQQIHSVIFETLPLQLSSLMNLVGSMDLISAWVFFRQ